MAKFEATFLLRHMDVSEFRTIRSAQVLDLMPLMVSSAASTPMPDLNIKIIVKSRLSLSSALIPLLSSLLESVSRITLYPRQIFFPPSSTSISRIVKIPSKTYPSKLLLHQRRSQQPYRRLSSSYTSSFSFSPEPSPNQHLFAAESHADPGRKVFECSGWVWMRPSTHLL